MSFDPAARELHHGGRAQLGFQRSPGGKTYVAAQRVAYPFHITRPFYLESDPEGMLTLYLQSVSGGIYPGDTVELSLSAGAGAGAHVTTQAATIVHGMANREASQVIEIDASAGAFVEYCPDPMILFPRASVCNSVRVRADAQSTVLMWDSFLNHDPAAEGKRFARLTSELRVERPDRTLVALDRFELNGEDLSIGTARPGERFDAHGTLVCLSPLLPAADLLAALNRRRDALSTVYFGASTLPGEAGVWSRMLARDPVALRDAMHQSWCALREALVGREPRPRPK